MLIQNIHKPTSLLILAMIIALMLPAVPPQKAQAAIADSDLAVKLKFDNNLSDSSPQSVAVAANGNPGYGTGVLGESIQLNSTSSNRQYLNLGKPASLQFGTDTDFTVAFWLKTPGAASDPPIITNKNWNNGANAGWLLALQPDKSMRWNYNTAGGSRADAKIAGVADGKWHHIVVSHDRKNGRADFYKDGIPVSVTAVSGSLYNGIASSMNIAGRTGTVDSGLATMIGNDGTGAYSAANFQMQLDDMQVIRKAVTAQEVTEMFAQYPPIELDETFKGSLRLIGAEHAVQGSTFRVNLDLRTPAMSTAIDRVNVELAYDSRLFEFESATKAMNVDTSAPGIVKLQLSAGNLYTSANPLEYSNSRISELFFKTKAPAGEGVIHVNSAEFYAGTSEFVKETFQASDVTVHIHEKEAEDLNQDGMITVGDVAIALKQGQSAEDLASIAAGARYAPYKRVLVIGIDGGGVSVSPDAPFWPTPSSKRQTIGNDVLALVPTLRSIIDNGAVSYTAQTTLPSSSSANWGAMLTGVGFEKHKIDNGDSALYYYSEDSPYPTVFKAIREAMPNRKLAAFVHWKNIIDGHIEPSVGVEVKADTDEEVAASMADYLASGAALDTSLMFVHLDDMDHAGHNQGFYTPAYYEQLKTVDNNVKTIYDALEDSGLLEDTLIVILPDHGGATENPDGTLGSTTSHGQDSPLAKTIFFAANGRTVASGGGKEKVLQGGATKDLAATVLAGLGLDRKHGDSQLIDGMFVSQAEQNKVGASNVQLTRIETQDDHQLKHYELALTDLQAEVNAMDIAIDTRRLVFDSIEPAQDGVEIVHQATEDGRLRLIVVSKDGIRSNEPVLVLKAGSEGAAAGTAVLQQAMLADSQGKETMPNLSNLAKEEGSGNTRIPVTGIQTVPSEVGLVEGYRTVISAEVFPANADNRKVTWHSSNEEVAKIVSSSHESAAVKAMKPGTAVITATTADGHYTAASAIEVFGKENLQAAVLDLKLDGDLKDASAAQNNGSAVGAVNFASGPFDEQTADLSGGYISLDPDKLKLGAGQNFTVAFWMKSGSQGGADTTIISNKDWVSGANQGWLIGMDKGNLTWNYKGANKSRFDLKPVAVTVGDNQWHHIAVSHNRTGSAVIYVDNKAIQTVSIADAGNIDTSLKLNIGADGKGAYPYHGMVGEMKVYAAALNGAEISALYESYFTEPTDDEKPLAALSGTTDVLAGNPFDVTYTLSNMYDAIYAQDLTFTYDSDKVEFVSAESVREGFQIISQSESSGKIRLLAASLGESNAVTEDGPLVRLNFRAKSAGAATAASIALSEAVISGKTGQEIQLDGASHSVAIRVGISGDVNGNGKVSIGDLAIVAKYYGKKYGDPDWDAAKVADVNFDNKIDIEDLATVAQFILE